MTDVERFLPGDLPAARTAPLPPPPRLRRGDPVTAHLRRLGAGAAVTWPDPAVLEALDADLARLAGAAAAATAAAEAAVARWHDTLDGGAELVEALDDEVGSDGETPLDESPLVRLITVERPRRLAQAARAIGAANDARLRRDAHLDAHRDTWAARLLAQVNDLADRAGAAFVLARDRQSRDHLDVGDALVAEWDRADRLHDWVTGATPWTSAPRRGVIPQGAGFVRWQAEKAIDPLIPQLWTTPTSQDQLDRYEALAYRPDQPPPPPRRRWLR